MHQYDTEFYRFVASFAARSAEQVVPLLTSLLPIDSIADFGCGEGAWLSVWRNTGVSVMGVDGPYVDRRRLMIDQQQFRAADLNGPIKLGRRFDLVQSLEVAEHLPADQGARFIETLIAHAPLIMFSAAVPGQGGEHHVNEQPLEYWREKFRERGYVAIDYLRPLMLHNPQIQHWYRYNIVLYAEESHLQVLPEKIRICRVPANQNLCDYWPIYHRIRHALVRQLPRGAVDSLARLKTRFEAKGWAIQRS